MHTAVTCFFLLHLGDNAPITHTHTQKLERKLKQTKNSMAADLSALAKWRGAIGTGGGDRSSFVDFVYFGRTDRERASDHLAAVWERHIRLYEAGQARLEKGEVSNEEHIIYDGAHVSADVRCVFGNTCAGDIPLPYVPYSVAGARRQIRPQR